MIDIRRAGVRLAALALLLAALTACAPKSAHDAFPGATAEAAWQSFQAGRTQIAPDRSFFLKASVNYASPKRSNRLLLSFWGNYDYPLRLDVSAGIGTPLGFWREARDGFVAYYPDQETAWLHEDGRAACAAMGFETPFTLRELASVLSGRYENLLPDRYLGASPVRDGFEFRLPKGRAAQSMVLDPQGRLLRLTGPAADGQAPWVVAFSEFEPLDPARPGRDIPRAVVISRGDVKGETPSGESATLRVKRLEPSAEPARPESLSLALPPGTAVKRLDEACPLPDVTS